MLTRTTMNKVILTREMIASGELDQMVARDAPAIRIYTDVEREASLRETLDARPDGDIWLFAYGSLIWNPTITPADCKVARVQGWHRSFCLSIVAGRGSTRLPGLVLGLDEGGDCLGVAYKMDPKLMEKELELLWRREMLTSGYVPRWVDIFDAESSPMGKALTFTIDRTAISYAGALTRDETITRLATGTGHLGSSADYLFATCDGLQHFGIEDSWLEDLADAVEAACPQSGGRMHRET